MRPPLRALFRRALQTTTVLAPVALSGCGPDTTGYTPLECDQSQLSVRGLAPSVIPDVIQLRSVMDRQFTDGGMPPVAISTSGTVCETATNKPACQTAFDALSPASGFAASCFQICIDYHLATTKGDDVKAVASLEQLKIFLGPIDTAQEALFIAFANGYNVACGQPDRGAAKAVGAGWEVLATKGIACGPGTALTRHFLSVTRDGDLTEKRSEVIEYGAPNCAIGRRPPGLQTSGRSGCDEVLGQFFAEVAHLEAASVPAFERMRVELAALGAPEALQRWALVAALEELDHTKRTAGLAQRFGGVPVVPVVSEAPMRTALELALDNATEGCVRETFGALVAQYQAAQAQDAGIRAVMADIAEDETRHAEFSWALAEWLEETLPEAQRAQVAEARRAAVEQLERELAAPVDEALVAQAGMPTAEVAQRLFGELRDSLSPRGRGLGRGQTTLGA